LSYVIQNFYKPYNFYIINIKTIKIIFLLNINFFFFFLKFTNLINLKISSNFFDDFQLFFFIKYFYNINFFCFFFNLKNIINGFYINNFSKSLIYWQFKTINLFFKFFSLPFINLNFSNIFSLNTYYLSNKVTPVNLYKKSYKNFFIFSYLLIATIWPAYATSFNFYLNFLLITNFFLLFKFFNGPFFKIYSF
jgi:hypothetical protein